MVRLKLFIELQYEIIDHVSDFIFNIHATQTQCQSLVMENLQVSQPVDVSLFTDPLHGNRYARLRALPGHLKVRYDAVVDITHHTASPDSVREVPIAELPAEALAYLYPSRYCQSDRLRQLANNEFGALPHGYWRVRAIQDWVQRQTKFVSGSSNATTSAVDTVVERVGVCRDFAHLMIALCRALNIPARFATGIDYASNPIFGPPDFHAYVEAFLGDRWYLFDPTGMVLPTGLIRLGTGRDAADVSFATIFGTVKSWAPLIGIEGVEDAASGIALPRACVEALSTDGAPA
jgi:transglutaminase-like putative cysteine protease